MIGINSEYIKQQLIKTGILSAPLKTGFRFLLFVLLIPIASFSVQKILAGPGGQERKWR